jgi:5-methylcytosine-specific restriction endonuclease McrA
MDKTFKGTPEEYIEFRKRRNEANKKYYSKPDVKAKKKAYKQVYDKENKDKIREWRKEHYSKPEVKERISKWRAENKEHLSLTGKEWRLKNKEYKAMKDREYQQKNRVKIQKNHLAWTKRNLEIVRKYNQKYYTSPKGIINYTHHNHRRLAIIKERPTDLTSDKILEIINRDKVCVYCGSNIRLELDHIIPLVRGGSCMFNNFVLACKKCNCCKNGRDVFEWCKIQGIEVPEIVIKLLKEQELNSTL